MDVGVSCVSSTSKFITNAQAVERDSSWVHWCIIFLCMISLGIIAARVIKKNNDAP